MYKFFTFIFIFILISCNPIVNNTNLFDRDFLFDDFDTLNSEIWLKINDTFKYSSKLSEKNTSISNGNLIINIPGNSLEGGGIKSSKNFRNGKFSIYVLNTNTNVATEIELFNQTWNITLSLRYHFNEIQNTNIVEFEALSPSLNLRYSISNEFQNTWVLMTIEMLRNSVKVYFNNKLITNINLDSSINEASISINGYPVANEVFYLSREIIVDYFSYERN
ncbi:MAG: hypothetical protein ACK4F9_04115 [Brevinematia bacterium]